MMFLHTPSLTEDAKHASVIVTSAIAALAGTISLFSLLQPTPVEDVAVVAVEVAVAPAIDASLGADRIYGRVTMISGEDFTGYVRWNDREASWADVLPAVDSDGRALAGLRFGHMTRLTPIRGTVVRAELKSGAVVDVSALRPAPGMPFAPLGIETPDGGVAEVQWHEVSYVDFLPEPLETAPNAERLHGTVITRSGMAFTGYVTWTEGEAFLDDVLEAAASPIPFEDVSEIHRRAEGGLLVVAAEGRSLVVEQLRLAGRVKAEISVADPALGNVVIPFERFRELRTHPADKPADYETFDGGRAIMGTLVTEAGESISGSVRWDRDEASTWELLDGQYNGVQFHIEMDQISWIKKTWLGATVELRDGRSFYLVASNDVNWTNKGIEVSGPMGMRLVSWSDFERFDFDLPASIVGDSR